jgi:hypothetical protein
VPIERTEAEIVTPREVFAGTVKEYELVGAVIFTVVVLLPMV